MKNRSIAAFIKATRACFVAGAVFAAAPAFAHPDIVLEYRLLFNFQGLSVNAIGESWTFDETFSQELINDFDIDHNGSFSRSESDALGKEVLGNLTKVDYFTYAKSGGQPIKGLRPVGFEAAIQKGIVTVTFGMRLPTPVDLTHTDLSIEIKDLEFSVGTSLAADHAVSLRGAPPGRCTVRTADNPADAYLDNLIVPQQTDVSCK